MKVNKIYIVTNIPIPNGYAPTNRILSYVSGFERNNVECEVVIFRKTERINKKINIDTKGIIGKTKYSYLYKSTVISKYFLKRRIDNILGIVRLFLYASFRMERQSAIIYYSEYTQYAFCLKMAKLLNRSILLLKEESEHPFVRKKMKTRFSWWVFNKIHYHLFDGLLLMTRNLINYFDDKYPTIPKVHIPMTVDLVRFYNVESKRKKIITYVGSLINEKDGILILLEAFSKVVDKFKEYKLIVCGYASTKKQKDTFLNLINELRIQRNIIFYENISRNKVPQLLKSSTVLVLPRPMSLQAQNGFPTKLGEYLASGVPTLVTSVGEIPHYLKDGESAFIAKPGDVDCLVQKLTEILDNYMFAIKVGQRGEQVAERYFNNTKQTKKIIDFIEDKF